jgi:hypothetical protein
MHGKAAIKPFGDDQFVFFEVRVESFRKRARGRIRSRREVNSAELARPTFPPSATQVASHGPNGLCPQITDRAFKTKGWRRSGLESQSRSHCLKTLILGTGGSEVNFPEGITPIIEDSHASNRGHPEPGRQCASASLRRVSKPRTAAVHRSVGNAGAVGFLPSVWS